MDDGRLDEPDDEKLLALAIRHPGTPLGRSAASRLLGRHQQRVYLWCRRYMTDHERALDLAQEVLLSAYRAMPSFEGRARFSSWLFAIARNKCLNAVRGKRLLVDDAVDPDAVAAEQALPEAALELEQNEQRLRDVLARHLAPDEREALWLSVAERLPVEEITRVMKLENATGARGLLQRARRRLRAVLERGQIGESV